MRQTKKLHFLITGHTGFKGAWLALLLHNQGHRVSGIALSPEEGSLFLNAQITRILEHDLRIDIRDREAIAEAFQEIQPDVVIHLAAQSLVLDSYKEPVLTFEVNVLGTLNVLLASELTASVKGQIIITTDKVYENLNQTEGYSEQDRLASKTDPYSASKVMADVLTQCWATSFPKIPTAIARAGNVIGGGDRSPNRLIPDIANAVSKGTQLKLRYPESVRPWQHVLDCLSGYLSLVDILLDSKAPRLSEWNFGPGVESFVPVANIVKDSIDFLSVDLEWQVDAGLKQSEAGLLALDATKSKTQLNWENKLPYPECLHWTLAWESAIRSGRDPYDLCNEQIAEYSQRN